MRSGGGAQEHRSQATVRGFDPGTGSGSVFLDDGTVCPFGAEVFAASGLRLLRRGQRVAIRRGPGRGDHRAGAGHAAAACGGTGDGRQWAGTLKRRPPYSAGGDKHPRVKHRRARRF